MFRRQPAHTFQKADYRVVAVGQLASEPKVSATHTGSSNCGHPRGQPRTHNALAPSTVRLLPLPTHPAHAPQDLGPTPDNLPELRESRLEDAQRRLGDALAKEAARLATRGKGVTAEAQHVFDAIHKTCVAARAGGANGAWHSTVSRALISMPSL